jgi:hypothetical protein
MTIAEFSPDIRHKPIATKAEAVAGGKVQLRSHRSELLVEYPFDSVIDPDGTWRLAAASWPPVITQQAGVATRVEVRDSNGRCRVKGRLDDPIEVKADGLVVEVAELVLEPEATD